MADTQIFLMGHEFDLPLQSDPPATDSFVLEDFIQDPDSTSSINWNIKAPLLDPDPSVLLDLSGQDSLLGSNVFLNPPGGTLISVGNLGLQPAFNDRRYLQENPDVAVAVGRRVFTSGFDHFTQFGQFENRAATFLNPPPGTTTTLGDLGLAPFFNEQLYLQKNPDVAEAVRRGDLESGFDHFAQFGQFENRAATFLNPPDGSATSLSDLGLAPTIDWERYVRDNPDVFSAVEKGLFASPEEHFSKFGKNEERPLYVVADGGPLLFAQANSLAPVTMGSVWPADTESIRTRLPKKFQDIPIAAPMLRVSSNVGTREPTQAERDALNAVKNWTWLAQFRGEEVWALKDYLNGSGKTYVLSPSTVDKFVNDIKSTEETKNIAGRVVVRRDPFQDYGKDVQRSIDAQIALGKTSGTVRGVTSWQPNATSDLQNVVGTTGLAFVYEFQWKKEGPEIVGTGTVVPIIDDVYDFEKNGQLPTSFPTAGIPDSVLALHTNQNGEIKDSLFAELSEIRGGARPMRVVGVGRERNAGFNSNGSAARLKLE